MSRFKTVKDVVDSRLCIGCGACSYACQSRNIELVDFITEGIRPRLAKLDDCHGCSDCTNVCPAVQTDFTLFETERSRGDIDPGFERKWGKLTGIWEGHAADPETRLKGSSGGALTAIAAYCIERLGMAGTLHIGSDPDQPTRNKTRLSKSREELLAACGSRYSPASVCDSLRLVEEAPSKCVVIGKPAEISALRNAQKLRPNLNEKVGVAMSFFCAETPPSHATDKLLESLRIDPSSVSDLRYRGNGWPGHFAPTVREETEPKVQLTYRESWAYLQKFRPWSTHLWPDGSGELADISCGDPWYEEPDGENPGFSLVVARSTLGKQIIEGAIEAGYITLQNAEPWKVEKSQIGLLNKKGSVWGRRLAMSLLGMPVTTFHGANLFRCWKRLPIRAKLQSTLGTLRRILQRKLYRPPSLAPDASCEANKIAIERK